MNIFLVLCFCGGMISMLDLWSDLQMEGLRMVGSSPGVCIVLYAPKKFNPHCLPPPRCLSGYWRQTAVRYHSIDITLPHLVFFSHYYFSVRCVCAKQKRIEESNITVAASEILRYLDMVLMMFIFLQHCYQYPLSSLSWCWIPLFGHSNTPWEMSLILVCHSCTCNVFFFYYYYFIFYL